MKAIRFFTGCAVLLSVLTLSCNCFNSDDEKTQYSSLPSSVTCIAPTDGSTGLSTETTELSWNAADRAWGYNVYFGSTNPPSFVKKTGKKKYVPSLASGTTYYWRITAYNNVGESTGSAVWSFSTTTVYTTPPGVAVYTSPSNGATGVFAGNLVLAWNAADRATSYKVYFGTTDPPPYSGETTSLSYNPGAALENTTYYWKVVPSNNVGDNTGGQTWSFTTGASLVGIAEAGTGSTTRIFDPKLTGASASIGYTLGEGGTLTVTVLIKDGSTTVKNLLTSVSRNGGQTHSESWDGRDDSGDFVDPGEYTVEVSASDGGSPDMATGTINVVRLGVASIDFNGPEAYTYCYHRRNTTDGVYWPVSGPEWKIGKTSASDYSDIDENNGSSRAQATAHAGLKSPPQDSGDAYGVEDDKFNLPACLKMGSFPSAAVTMGLTATSQQTPGSVSPGYPVSGVPIRVKASGWASGSDEDLQPGDTTTLASNTALESTIGKETLQIQFLFEYYLLGEWHPVPGSQSTSHTVYRVYDSHKLSHTGNQYYPWVSVLDRLATFCQGQAANPDTEEIAYDVTNGLLACSSLTYDTVAGAPSFSNPQVTGNSTYILLSGVTLDLTSFFDYSTVYTINCSDAAGLLSTFLSMAGVDAYYFQIWNFQNTGNGFLLNYIKAVGHPSFTNEPFGPGYNRFSYHAIVTTDTQYDFVSDSCLWLDGDSNPSSTPCVELVPAYMDEMDYLSTLSPEYALIGETLMVKCVIE